MKTTSWSNRLAFEIALRLEGSGEDVNDILTRNGHDPSQMLVFTSDPTFLRTVQHYREEIRDKGLTFKLKARAQAEELLTTSWLLIHNADVSPAVKADLIKSTVKWAGLDNTPEAGESGGGGAGVKITINLADTSPKPKVIEHEPDENLRETRVSKFNRNAQFCSKT